MELAVGTEVPVIAAQKSTLSLFCLNFFKDYDLHLFHFFVQISGVLNFICPSIKWCKMYFFFPNVNTADNIRVAAIAFPSHCLKAQR